MTVTREDIEKLLARGHVNKIAALGPEAVPILVAVLTDKERILVHHWFDDVGKSLVAERTVEEITTAITRMGISAVPGILPYLTGKSSLPNSTESMQDKVYCELFSILSKLGKKQAIPEAVDPLVNLLERGNFSVQTNALYALESLVETTDLSSYLSSFLRKLDSGSTNSKKLVDAIIKKAGECAVPDLVNEVIIGRNPAIAIKCIFYLSEIASKSKNPEIIRQLFSCLILSGGNDRVESAVKTGFLKLGKSAVPVLIGFLSNLIRQSTALDILNMLALRQDIPEAVKPVIGLLDEFGRVSEVAAEALSRMFGYAADDLLAAIMQQPVSKRVRLFERVLDCWERDGNYEKISTAGLGRFRKFLTAYHDSAAPILTDEKLARVNSRCTAVYKKISALLNAERQTVKLGHKLDSGFKPPKNGVYRVAQRRLVFSSG